jgi:hypothetical protein
VAPLRQRPTYEQVIEHIENDTDKIKYPDREAKFLRNSFELSFLDSFNHEQLQEQQNNVIKNQLTQQEIQKAAMKNKTSITTQAALSQPSSFSKIMKGLNGPSRFDGIHSGSRMRGGVGIPPASNLISGGAGMTSNILSGVGRFMGNTIFGSGAASSGYNPQEEDYYSAPEEEPAQEQDSVHESAHESEQEQEHGIIPSWLFLPTSPEDAYNQYLLAKQQEIEEQEQMKSKKSESVRSQASESLNDLSQQQGVILPLPENTAVSTTSLPPLSPAPTASSLPALSPALSPAPTHYYIGSDSSRAPSASSRQASVKHEYSASSSRKSAFSSGRSKPSSKTVSMSSDK